MNPRSSTSWIRALGVVSFISLDIAFALTPAWAAGTFYVDGTNASCSNAGPGTPANPYCSITAAVNAQGGPGTTIIVMPGTYSEQVTVSASGTSGNPFVIRASGAGVVLEEADDFSVPGFWTLVSGNVWRAPTATWLPKQVFLDGARLTAALGDSTLIPAGSFQSNVTGVFVNAGGSNPGTHTALIGHRGNGFRVNARSFVTIDGFTVRHAEDKGIYLLGGSTSISVLENSVSFCASNGIASVGGSSVTIGSNIVSDNGDHGILFQAGVTASDVEDNESFRNARPVSRAANGLMVFGSSGNRIQRNRWHDNQDSGEQFSNGSNNNVSIQNRSWSNGDHGYDHLTSTGTFHVDDVAWGNFRDGFSFEGSSPGGKVLNCIATDNGLTSNEFDLWVDAGSSVGLVSNSNIFWNSTAQPPIKYGLTIYANIADYRSASGLDGLSFQADPKFVNPAAGDFHLQSGSPAIDDADSSDPDWPITDAEGRARLDDPLTANTGLGTVTYADRGALEFVRAAVDQPPVVTAPVLVSGNEATQIVVNVTASDPDGNPITSLGADVTGLPAGNNASFLPNATNTAGTLTWTPTRNDGRAAPYSVTFTAMNALTGTASTSIQVIDVPDRAPVVVSPASVTGNEASQIVVNVTASDLDNDPITSLTADVTGLPAGNNAAFLPNATNTAGTLTWTPTRNDGRAAPYSVTFTAMNALSGSSSTAIQVIDVPDRAPVVVAPASVTGNEASQIVVNVTASDLDNDPITSLTADVTGLPVGHNAVFLPNATNTAGTLTWTPTLLDGRVQPYIVTFTAMNALSGSSTTSIRVIDIDKPPVVVAPAAVTDSEEVAFTFDVTASDPDGDPITSLSMDPSGLPAGNTAVFNVNATNTIGTFVWTPTLNDGRNTPYTVTFRATNALTGTAVTSVRIIDVPDRAPVVTASPPNPHVPPNAPVAIAVVATDPDGDPITSLSADLTKLPLGNNATFVVNPGNQTGTFTWTPLPADKGRNVVTFTATAGSKTTSLLVKIQVKPHVVASAEPGQTPDDEDAAEVLPDRIALSGAFPNPSRSDVEFTLDLPAATRIDWTVVDVRGRRVWDESRSAGAGRTTLRWATADRLQGAGVYFARVRIGDVVLVRRFMVLE